MNCRKCGTGSEDLQVTSDKGPQEKGPIELTVKCNKCGVQYTEEIFGEDSVIHQRGGRLQ
uniref:Uncharacterized protein n=1 Tax=viral metagenome TaxID=1070528 RepID=A0A6M3MG87_9ZZZZ